MAEMIPVEVQMFPKHEKAPDFIPWNGSLWVRKDDIDKVIAHLEKQRGEKFPKIPYQAKESQNGSVYLEANIFVPTGGSGKPQVARAFSGRKSLPEDDIDMSSVPF